MQRVYQSKAEEDCAAVLARAEQLATAAGAPAGTVTRDLVASMCKNARNLRVVRYRSLAEELEPKTAFNE